jgi:hypothetical protein
MVSQIYHNNTIKNNQSANFNSIPFSNGSITFNSGKASTASFNSIKKLNEGDKIRIIGDNHREFGGQINKPGAKLKDGAYSYECIDYTRLFFGKTVTTYSGGTSYEILKFMLEAINYSTAGLKPTTKRHGALRWKGVTRWEIIQQLRWLDYQAGELIEAYVNADGTLIYQPMEETHEGYIFKSAYEYSQDYDASNIVTGARTIYEDDKENIYYLANVNDENLLAVWGWITEVEEGC